MYHALRRLSLCVLVALLLPGCDSQRDAQEEFVARAEGAAEGFVRTDAAGAILEDDPDDWRTAPLFAGRISFRPAYPNPTTGEPVTLSFTTLEFNAVTDRMTLRYRDPADPRRLPLLDEITNASQTGGHDFRFSPTQIGVKGLHRLFVFDGFGELVTYGDVMLE